MGSEISSVRSRKLLIAFDVGDTHSGVAFCFLHPTDGLQTNEPQIETVTRFPGGNSRIPSVFYEDAEGQLKAAGAEARDLNSAEREGSVKLGRLRSLLSGLDEDGRSSTQILDKPRAQAYAVFLRYLYDCTKKFIMESRPERDESSETETEFILCHPGSWNQAQRDELRSSAVLAGFLSSENRNGDRLRLTSDGEAGLRYCLKHSGLPVGDEENRIVVVDAGGTSTAISSYKISAKMKQIQELAPTEYLHVGSSKVTNTASDFFKNRIRDSEYDSAEILDALTTDFDRNANDFSDPNDPTYVHFGAEGDVSPTINIEAGRMMLTGAEMEALFEPLIFIISEGIKKAINDFQITIVYLFGGFASNEWFFKRLQNLPDLADVVADLLQCRANAVSNGAIQAVVAHVPFWQFPRPAQVAQPAEDISPRPENQPERLENESSQTEEYPHLEGESTQLDESHQHEELEHQPPQLENQPSRLEERQQPHETDETDTGPLSAALKGDEAAHVASLYSQILALEVSNEKLRTEARERIKEHEEELALERETTRRLAEQLTKNQSGPDPMKDEPHRAQTPPSTMIETLREALAKETARADGLAKELEDVHHDMEEEWASEREELLKTLKTLEGREGLTQKEEKLRDRIAKERARAEKLMLEKNELQSRLEAQSTIDPRISQLEKEGEGLRKKLRDLETQNEGLRLAEGRSVALERQLAELRAAYGRRGEELSRAREAAQNAREKAVGPTFLSPEEMARASDVALKMEELNYDLFQAAAAIAEDLGEEQQEADGYATPSESLKAYDEVFNTVGMGLANLLRVHRKSEARTALQIALQSSLATWANRIIQSWGGGPAQVDLYLEQLYKTIRAKEGDSIAKYWRTIAFSNCPNFDSQWEEGFLAEIVDSLATLMVVAGHSPTSVRTHLTRFDKELVGIAGAALILRGNCKENLGLECVQVERGSAFDEELMEDTIPTRVGASYETGSGAVLCMVGLGLRQVEGVHEMGLGLLVKPQVVLQSVAGDLGVDQGGVMDAVVETAG